MALVLCQQCLSWVEPIAEQCPQCDYPIDLRAPDPTLEEIAVAIGPLVSQIGPVRVSRTSLPDRGVIYATAGGLFFVPEYVECVRLIPAERYPRSVRSVLLAPLRVPLRILRRGTLSGLWGVYRSPMRVEISRIASPPLGPDDSDRLAGLLMDNPGVFFFARRSIRTIRRTFAGWTLMRANSLALRLRPLDDRASFHKQMTAFADEVHEAVCR